MHRQTQNAAPTTSAVPMMQATQLLRGILGDPSSARDLADGDPQVLTHGLTAVALALTKELGILTGRTDLEVLENIHDSSVAAIVSGRATG